MTIKNAKQLPQVYYGLHFLPGCAEYREPGKEPFRIFINEDTIRSMNPTFAGRPVYVRHKDEVNLENIQAEADGYVVKSFYNAVDGKTWCEFIVVSDRGHDAIRGGWKLSNAYVPKGFGSGGLWNGISYEKEVTAGEYEHLALVQDPRYQESIILTPEQFKTYNSEKELELKKLSNSHEKGEGSMSKFNWFKRAKVENSSDLELMSVTLPKSGKEFTITQLINDMDAMEEAKKEPMMANGEHMVEVGDKKMTVNELVAKHMEMMGEKKENDDQQEKPEGEMPAPQKAQNEEDQASKDANKEGQGPGATKNALTPEQKADKAKHGKELREAPYEAFKNQATPIDLSQDRMKRGKQRYGSA